jgi:hypothetical protein
MKTERERMRELSRKGVAARAAKRAAALLPRAAFPLEGRLPTTIEDWQLLAAQAAQALWTGTLPPQIAKELSSLCRAQLQAFKALDFNGRLTRAEQLVIRTAARVSPELAARIAAELKQPESVLAAPPAPAQPLTTAGGTDGTIRNGDAAGPAVPAGGPGPSPTGSGGASTEATARESPPAPALPSRRAPPRADHGVAHGAGVPRAAEAEGEVTAPRPTPPLVPKPSPPAIDPADVDPNSAFLPDGQPKTMAQRLKNANDPRRFEYRGPSGREYS